MKKTFSFTTEPPNYIKRGNKTVRQRCIEFVETLRLRKFKELPIITAQDCFSYIIDHWDRTTLKAYFGQQEHVNRTEICKTKEYSGQVYHSRIGLVQKIEYSRGYLEKLDLVHYEKRGNTWFMIINENGPLIPELMKVGNQSNDNFSLASLDSDLSSKGVQHPMARSKCLVLPSVGGEREERECKV
jgi:hypothetical protein